MVNFKETYHFQGSREGPTFSRGVQLFLGGSNCLFPIETHITCDFPGGSGPPVPPPSGSALVFIGLPEGHNGQTTRKAKAITFSLSRGGIKLIIQNFGLSLLRPKVYSVPLHLLRLA